MKLGYKMKLENINKIGEMIVIDSQSESKDKNRAGMEPLQINRHLDN